jgi:hypothetical protein
MQELARAGKLTHVDDEATRLVIDKRTEQIHRTQLAEDPARVRGRRAFGELTLLDSLLVKVALVPTFDGAARYDSRWSTTELVRRFTGVRSYRLEHLAGQHSPANVISFDPRLTSGSMWEAIAKAAGLLTPDAANLGYPLTDEVAGKHVLGPYPSWEVASAAERITWVGPAADLHADLLPMASQLERGRLESLDGFVRIMGEAGATLTFRVHEVRPENLSQL